MKSIKRTPDNQPYLAAAIFFLSLLLTCVIFCLVAQFNLPAEGGLADREQEQEQKPEPEQEVLGSGTGDGVGDGVSDRVGEKEGKDEVTTPGDKTRSGEKAENVEQKEKGTEGSSPVHSGKKNDHDVPVSIPEDQPVAKLQQEEDPLPQEEQSSSENPRPEKFSSGGKSVFNVKKHENVLFILDVSGSMFSYTSENISRIEVMKIQLMATIKTQAEKKSSGKYGIIIFSSPHYYFPAGKKTQLRFSSNADFKETKDWLDNWNINLQGYLGGGTMLYPALQQAVFMIQTKKIKVDTIYLLTDGQPYDGVSDQDYIKLLKNLPKKIRVNTISIGLNSPLLMRIAKEFNGLYSEFK